MSNHLIQGKNLVLLESLINFYSKNYNIFNYIITNKNNLSLRILDWLVTNYAKKHNILYKIKKNGQDINFNIYIDYKNQLKAYSKKLFDPFCRRDRILINLKTLEYKIINNDIKNINYDIKNELLSTVGQLNFFRWFIENDIYNYAISNIEKIDLDMTETLKKTKSNTKSNNKRCELSESANKFICKLESRTVICFD